MLLALHTFFAGEENSIHFWASTIGMSNETLSWNQTSYEDKSDEQWVKRRCHDLVHAQCVGRVAPLRICERANSVCVWFIRGREHVEFSWIVVSTVCPVLFPLSFKKNKCNFITGLTVGRKWARSNFTYSVQLRCSFSHLVRTSKVSHYKCVAEKQEQLYH